MAMKYEENQERLFEASIVRNSEKVLVEEENELVSPHQHILDLITESLILNDNQISLQLTAAPTEKQDKPIQILEQEVDKKMQALELEILISIDWQLGRMTGPAIVRSILNLSSCDYDFSLLADLVE